MDDKTREILDRWPLLDLAVCELVHSVSDKLRTRDYGKTGLRVFYSDGRLTNYQVSQRTDRKCSQDN